MSSLAISPGGPGPASKPFDWNHPAKESLATVITSATEASEMIRSQTKNFLDSHPGNTESQRVLIAVMPMLDLIALNAAKAKCSSNCSEALEITTNTLTDAKRVVAMIALQGVPQDANKAAEKAVSELYTALVSLA